MVRSISLADRMTWAACGTLLLAAVVLLGMSAYASLHSGTVAIDQVLLVEPGQSALKSDSFDLGADHRVCRLEISDLGKSSTLNLKIELVMADGNVVTTRKRMLGRGVQQVQTQPVRSTETAIMLLFEVAHAGTYRFQIHALAPDDSHESANAQNQASRLRVLVRSDINAFRYLLVSGAVCLVLLVPLVLSRFRGTSMEHAPRDATPQSKDRFVFIDGLRGVAALAVVICHVFVPYFCHFAGHLISALPSWMSALAKRGELGVEIFFVLSGFVIAFSIRERAVTWQFAWKFALRRSLRLDPPYYLTLALTMIGLAYVAPLGLTGVLDDMGGVRGVLLNMFYLQDIFSYPAPVAIAWTLCLELQFYLALVVLTRLSQTLAQSIARARGHRQSTDGTAESFIASPMMLIYVPLVVISLWTWYPNLEQFSFFGTWFRFFLGALVYWVISRRTPAGWLLALVVAIGVLSAWAADERGMAALASALLIYIAARRGSLTVWLSGRWIQILGRISYSLYLMHVFVGVTMANYLWDMTGQTTPKAILCAVVAISMGLAGGYLMYRFVEVPSIDLSRRIRY